jgi:lipopolysaccharide export system protein LptA
MKNCLRPWIALAALALATQSVALESDRDQPADIEADDIEFDFKKGTRTYTNNVLAVQGTLRLKADKLIAIYTEGELVTATAWGSLARFKQRPDGKPNDVEGWAKKIIVNQTANTLTLIGKAALKQGADTARGETIVYNMATDTLNVRGGAKVAGGGKPGAAKPKRKIEDPFASNTQGPTADAPSAIRTTEAINSQAEAEPQVTPIHSGRSRLIIQPKALKKPPVSEYKKKKNKKNKEGQSEEKQSEEKQSEEKQSEEKMDQTDSNG